MTLACPKMPGISLNITNVCVQTSLKHTLPDFKNPESAIWRQAFLPQMSDCKILYFLLFSSCEALKQCAVNSAVGPAEQVGRLYAFCPDSTIFFTIQSHAIPLDSSNCE